MRQAVPLPATPSTGDVDELAGVQFPDPYRWLESASLPETVRWVEEENALLRRFVDGPSREALRRRLAELYDYPRLSVPERRGGRYFYFRNAGLQDQSVLYVREGEAERVLLDPNTLSSDGTVALTLAAPTREALQRYFSNAEQLRVRFSKLDIVIEGNEALATFTRSDDFVDAQTGMPVHLEDAIHQVQDPIVREAGARVQAAFVLAVQRQARLADLDDEHGPRGVFGHVVAKAARDHGDVQ